jgi:hypothetical protein
MKRYLTVLSVLTVGCAEELNAVETEPLVSGCEQPRIVDEGAAQASWQGSLVDAMTGTPIEGVKVTVCEAGDHVCDETTAWDVALTDGDGVVDTTFPLDADGYDGWLRFERDGYVPTIFVANPPIVGDYTSSTPVLSTLAFDAFALLSDVAPDADLGHVASVVTDCDWNFTDGASLDTAPAGQAVVYTSDGFPDLDAVSTDASGAAVAFNVPVGEVAASVAREDGSSSSTAIVVRPGFLTQVVLTP